MFISSFASLAAARMGARTLLITMSVDKIAAMAKEKSSGRIDIQSFPNGQLGSALLPADVDKFLDEIALVIVLGHVHHRSERPSAGLTERMKDEITIQLRPPVVEVDAGQLRRQRNAHGLVCIGVFAVSHHLQHRQLGIGPGNLSIRDLRYSRWPKHARNEATAAAHVNGLRGPARASVIHGNHQQRDRALEPRAQTRDIRGPNILLALVRRELDLDDNSEDRHSSSSNTTRSARYSAG